MSSQHASVHAPTVATGAPFALGTALPCRGRGALRLLGRVRRTPPSPSHGVRDTQRSLDHIHRSIRQTPRPAARRALRRSGWPSLDRGRTACDQLARVVVDAGATPAASQGWCARPWGLDTAGAVDRAGSTCSAWGTGASGTASGAPGRAAPARERRAASSAPPSFTLRAAGLLARDAHLLRHPGRRDPQHQRVQQAAEQGVGSAGQPSWVAARARRAPRLCALAAAACPGPPPAAEPPRPAHARARRLPHILAITSVVQCWFM
jgi:hypothetical protein